MLQQINASAGSGKTYTLTRQFLTLLGNAVETERSPACAIGRAPGDPHCWPEILAATFTNKAATEMRERIVRSLKERALDPQARNAASDWDAKTAAHWVDVLLRRFSSLNVRTIDSLLNMLVRLSALELGLPPDFTPVFDDRELFDPLYDRLLDNARAGGPERDMVSEACQTLVRHTDWRGFAPKNAIRSRLYDILRLRLETEDPYVPESSAHPEDLDNPPYSGTTVTAPPPVADAGMLRGWLVNLHTDYVNAAAAVSRLLSQEQLSAQANFIKFLATCAEGSPFHKPKSSVYAAKASIDDCLLKASKGKASDDLAAAYADLSNAYREFDTTGHLVRRALELVPFCQLALPMLRMLHEEEQAQGKVLNALWPRYARMVLSGEAGASEAFCRMGTRLTHLLIDEFQDTSAAQWQAIRPLALECLSKGGSLTYVGDVKQAIYGWRGGDSALFDAVPADPEIHAVAPDAKITNLPYNWRSAEAIVSFNNAVFTRLAEPDITTRFAERMLSGAPDIVRQTMIEDITRSFSGAAQDVPVHRENSGGYVCLYDVTAERTEGLREIMEERLTTLLHDELLPRRSPGDIAILVRTNTEAGNVAKWLVDHRIPVITENSLSLTQHPAVRQTVALLRFLDYPMDDLAFWEFLSGASLFGPVSGLDAETLNNWLARTTKRPLFTAFREDYPHLWQHWLAPFYAQAGLMSAYDTVREAFTHFDAFRRLPQDAVFLRRFLEVVFAAEEQGMHALSDFLDYWSSNGGEEKIPMPETVDAVRVMTMHKSKGLEFPVVIIPFHHHTLTRNSDPQTVMVHGRPLLLPSCKEAGVPYYQAMAAEIREQLHLLYVAWTRPVEELYAFITSTPRQESVSPSLAALRLMLEPYGMGPDRDQREASVSFGTPPPPRAVTPRKQVSSPAAPAHTTEQETLLAQAEFPTPKPAWFPMQWLPRLKIFRNPLADLFPAPLPGSAPKPKASRTRTTGPNSTPPHAMAVSLFSEAAPARSLSERHRGILIHACLERLRLAPGARPREEREAAVLRAIRHGMRASAQLLPVSVNSIPPAETTPCPSIFGHAAEVERLEAELRDMFLWLVDLPQFTTWQQHGTPEQTLVDTHGTQHRTDLLVRENHSLTVVEYKTGQPDSAHSQQITRYINLLAAIPAYAQYSLHSTLVYLDHRKILISDHPRATTSSTPFTDAPHAD